jgi:hypothetical protein
MAARAPETRGEDNSSGDRLLNRISMAIYVYETIPKNPKAKPRRFEVEQKMSEPALKTDPKTGEPVRRVITGGSGWVTHGASILSMKVRRSRR